MQKQELISIKDAATSTGVSEEAIRKHIRSGKISGEKKNYIFWDEWFVTQKDLAKIRDSVEVKDVAQPSQTEPGSQEREMHAAEMAGVAMFAGADNGIKSKFNYSWMPHMSNKNETEKVRAANDTSLPQSLAAEIERAFAPNTVNSAFGARAYLEHADQSTGISTADDLDSPEKNDFGQPNSAIKFSTARQMGRRRKAAEAERAAAQVAAQSAATESGAGAEAFTSKTTGKTATAAPTVAPWNDYRTIAKTVAEEFLAPLLYRLEVQATQLHEKDILIAEQAAQLRLLPDFQRQSEEARRLAEKKQQEALQLRQNYSWERKKALIKISAWQMKHVKIERQLASVEQQVTEIQDQKESEVNYLHCQLTQLQEQLSAAQRPWWKKIFKA